MSKREQLMEEYEDALFALLMDEVMQIEGEEAIRWNEELKLDPQYAVPENITHQCEKTIKNEFRKKERKLVKQSAYKIFQKISVAVMITMLLFTTAFAVSEPLRRITLNALLTINEQFSKFNFVETESHEIFTDTSTGETVEYHYNIGLEWVPTRYQVVDGITFPNGEGMVEYQNDNGETIKLRVIRFDTTPSYKLDTEGAEITEVTVKDQQAYLIEKKIESENDSHIELSLLCVNEKQNIVMDIISTGLTKDEILQLAEGMHWKKINS